MLKQATLRQATLRQATLKQAKLTQVSRWSVLALLGTAFFMTILDGTSLLTALPSIKQDLRLGGTAAQ